MRSGQVIRLSDLSEEGKLELALKLLEDSINRGTFEDVYELYVNMAGPHGLSESDLDALVLWLSGGTSTFIE